MIEFTSKIPSLCECGCPIQALCMQSSTSSGSTSKGDAGPDLTTPLLDLTLQRCRDLAEFANRAQLVKEQFELKLLPPTPMCSLLLPPQVLQTTLKLRPCGSFLGAGLELLICRRFWGRSTCLERTNLTLAMEASGFTVNGFAVGPCMGSWMDGQNFVA